MAIVVLPAGYVALGKVAQSLVHGARIVQVEGNFDDALRLTQKLTEAFPVALVNSVNPHRLEGQKTLAFEVVDELGDAPHYHALPVGNAGNITAHWMGYKAYHALGKAKRLPRMLGFQAAGAAPLVLGRPVERPETLATAIRIGNPASWQGAVRAKEESGGHRGGDGRGDPLRLPLPGPGGRDLLRARKRRRHGGGLQAVAGG